MSSTKSNNTIVFCKNRPEVLEILDCEIKIIEYRPKDILPTTATNCKTTMPQQKSEADKKT